MVNFTQQFEQISVIPLIGKKPTGAWKQYQTEYATPEERSVWFGKHNIGLVTGRISDLIVVDFDDKELARTWFKNHRSFVKVIVETRRGLHFYFRCPDSEVRNSQGTPDIRGEGGYVVAPPSVVQEHKYRFIEGYDKLEERTVFNPSWFAHEKPITKNKIGGSINAVRKYIAKIVAVAGEGGHNATYRAACKLRDAGLSEAEVLAELIQWNETNALPQWTLQQLTHKAKDVFQ